MEKNYYQILNIDQSARAEDIKKSYRQLALKYHPDRNPNDPAAEEKFKLISEAYAVLINPGKRAEYNRSLRAETIHGPGADTGFTYRQDEIFREFFQSAYARQAFQDLNRQFSQSGVRFDEDFLNNLFFGGRGFIVRGFVFTWPGPQGSQAGRKTGSTAGPGFQRRKAAFQTKPRDISAASNPVLMIGERLGRMVREKVESVIKRLLPMIGQTEVPGDITFNLTVSRDQARTGDRVEIQYNRNGLDQKVLVTIPPGTKNGARLRLKGMGRRDSGSTGDLYLHIKVSARAPAA